MKYLTLYSWILYYTPTTSAIVRRRRSRILMICFFSFLFVKALLYNAKCSKKKRLNIYNVTTRSKRVYTFVWFVVNSGDHDITIPFHATQAWIKYLNYSIIHDWRPWMIKVFLFHSFTHLITSLSNSCKDIYFCPFFKKSPHYIDKYIDYSMYMIISRTILEFNPRDFIHFLFF